MNKSIIIFSLVFLFHGASNLLHAQTTLQVVTKNIEKTLEYKKGYSLQISGEKAAIVVDTWELDKIQVNIQLTAKHPELETAEQDLEYFKYVSERIGKTIYLRNFIAIPKGKNKPSSKYKASFKVMVPQECKVELSNDFGNAEIKNLKGQLTVKSNFCKTELHNLTGEISIHSKFGDIKGDQLSGLVDINSTRSDITLSQMEGTYKITSKYGVIRINADEELLNLNIDAEKTDIHFYNRELGRYQYALITDHGEIKFPKSMRLDFDQITEYTKKASSKDSKSASVNIQTSFGNITIEEQAPQ